MTRHVTGSTMALIMLKIWLPLAIVIVCAYFIYLAWRKRHPKKPATQELPYARKLQGRLSKQMSEKKATQKENEDSGKAGTQSANARRQK